MTRDTGYEKAHYWLRRDRGKASEHDCLDCGGQAKDWSYRGGCPDELVGTTPDYRYPETRLIPYSLDQSYYDPLCRTCHVARDKHFTKEYREQVKLRVRVDPA